MDHRTDERRNVNVILQGEHLLALEEIKNYGQRAGLISVVLTDSEAVRAALISLATLIREEDSGRKDNSTDGAQAGAVNGYAVNVVPDEPGSSEPPA